MAVDVGIAEIDRDAAGSHRIRDLFGVVAWCGTVLERNGELIGRQVTPLSDPRAFIAELGVQRLGVVHRSARRIDALVLGQCAEKGFPEPNGVAEYKIAELRGDRRGCRVNRLNEVCRPDAVPFY